VVRILVAESIAAEGLEALRAQHDVDVRLGLSPDELVAAIGEYEGLVVRSQVKADARVVAAGTRLQVIGRAGVGVDNVDLDAATAAGIVVVNAPTGNTIAAAEHTIALLLAVARRIAEADASVRRGEWKRSQFQGVELRGRTLGIVGLGKIGLAIADRARGLEMHLIGHDPFVTPEQAAIHGVELVDLETLIARSDAITVHVPLTRTTAGMIDAAAMARMKPGSIVLNVARGGIVDEAALAEALRSGHLGGAGIDVYTSEPPAGDSPLLTAPRAVLTPHLGASTAEAQVAVGIEVAEQVLDVLSGRPARAAVNAPYMTAETARLLGPFLPLAELLGRVFAQLAGGVSGDLTVTTTGDPATVDGAPIDVAVLRGLIEDSTTDRVTPVNATSLARARGISVVERRDPDGEHGRSTITLEGRVGGRRFVVGGAVADGAPRLVRLMDYRLDMAPTETMLVTRHDDRPGTIGRLGRILGEADVNISSMQLARERPREEAMMLLALDDDVAPEVEDRLRRDEAVREVRTIRLAPHS
jgi:D-3-phosphoglycerate dehydrogenase